MNKTNVQEQVLNYLRKNKTKCTLFLLSGFVYTGVQIIAYDQYSILISHNPHNKDKDAPIDPNRPQQNAMVFKHAISTFGLPHPIDITNKEEGAAPAASQPSAPAAKTPVAAGKPGNQQNRR